MSSIPIVNKNVNLEILTKLLNSVAKKYGCRVEYIADDNRIKFFGDMDCCRHITEEMLTIFAFDSTASSISISCPREVYQQGGEISVIM